MSYAKPLPVPDAESEPFWNGCKGHRLMIQRCTACGTPRFPATSFCAKCTSGESEWISSSGFGKVFSWIVVRHPVPADVYADSVPYVVALVTLDENVRMVANIEGCTPEQVTANMDVVVGFKDVSDDTTLPVFRPVGS